MFKIFQNKFDSHSITVQSIFVKHRCITKPGCRTSMDMSNLSMDSRLFHVYSMKKPGNLDIVQETWTRTGWTSMDSVHGQHKHHGKWVENYWKAGLRIFQHSNFNTKIELRNFTDRKRLDILRLSHFYALLV